jgi:alpha-tubulin suppressor-like RCC1 family protein
MHPRGPKRRLADSADTHIDARKRRPEYSVLTQVPTQKLNVFACGTGDNAELGLRPNPEAKIIMRPRLNTLLSLESTGIVDIAYGNTCGLPDL